MRFLRCLVAVFVAVAILAGFAGAQEPPTREEQIQRIRALPPDEKRRLKEALDRFNALPPAEREALRRKARDVGIERLGELAGRDFEKLKRKHEGMQAEMDEVFGLLGGPERLASLTPLERDFVRAEATRGFQQHLKIRMLDSARVSIGFKQLQPAEQRARMAQAFEAMVQRLLAERSPADQARFLALPAAEQKRERAKLLAEWRMRETPNFAKKFEAQRLLPLFAMTPEKRQAVIANRVRWFQLTNLLAADGVDRESMRMLEQLRTDERAQVGDYYEEGRELPANERRARIETRIRELYGKGALDGDRSQRPALRHPEILRALRERRRAEPPAPPAPVAPPK